VASPELYKPGRADRVRGLADPLAAGARAVSARAWFLATWLPLILFVLLLLWL
jgi:hypothetical protein